MHVSYYLYYLSVKRKIKVGEYADRTVPSRCTALDLSDYLSFWISSNEVIFNTQTLFTKNKFTRIIPSAVVCSMVGLLSLWQSPNFHSQFYLTSVSLFLFRQEPVFNQRSMMIIVTRLKLSRNITR